MLILFLHPNLIWLQSQVITHPYIQTVNIIVNMIVFAKVNLKIYYPPPYYHQIWHHQDGDTELLKNEIKIYSIGKKLMQIIWIRLKLQQ